MKNAHNALNAHNAHNALNALNKASSDFCGNLGLSGLARLEGLVVKETAPTDVADFAMSVQAMALAKFEAQKAKDVVRVSRETKGRGGKAVTLVKGISLPELELETLGKQLKTACGSGGTVKDRMIEVQGDHCERVVSLLVAQGYKAKRAGG
jgi:translation initiation factor 1